MEAWFKLIEFASGYPPYARLLAIGGLLVTVVTLFLAPRIPIAERSGITIDEPKNGQSVAWSFPVRGKYRDLPKESELWVITTDSTGRRYWPQSRAVKDDTKREWSAHVSGIGGAPGAKRTFGVFLVGHDGQALLELWQKAVNGHPQLELTSLTRDLQRADEVAVIGPGRP